MSKGLLRSFKSAVKATPAIHLWVYYKRWFAEPKPQNDEAKIINRLLSLCDVPKTFIEFGFGAWEFTCADLIHSHDGLLVDADEMNVWYGRKTLPKRVRCEQRWLELENLDVIREFAASREVGILSIDVDGNDYWFLKELIDIRPAIVVCEYNSSFGLRPLTVPYDPSFSRFKKDPSGLYFGASITALRFLCNQHDYALVELSKSGINAFFVRRDLLPPETAEVDLATSFSVKKIPEARTLEEQWAIVQDLEFVDVTK